ncbi:DNA-processing protein DprA [Subtercola sp. RTI3]|uniref:DNA-processing protein DprA n=1 Tax=Subtercola sp. RTI3 TaxID=3048639 RepID=UPI002B225294|nr:DNA-processing protein DprA [Subtercola sp. RTI3]MEA9986275.1 DNA-processing protein DprA [Subtercola sp. RTI3]
MSIFSLDEKLVIEAVLGVSGVGAPRGAGAAAGAVNVSAGAGAGAAEVEAEAEARPEIDTVALAERFARATWSGLAEPGDVTAGALVGALGASVGLTLLVERASPRAVLERVIAGGDETTGGGGIGGEADELTEKALTQAIERWMPRLAANSALTSLRLAHHSGARLLTPDDDLWPSSLADLGGHEPLALWVRGPASAIAGIEHSVALVGARAATGYGEHMAMELSAGLSDRGWGIVSGAAYGIDGMAHRAALASSGLTVAFLAGGVDRFYPSGHDSLLKRISEVGLVVSELPCGSPPTKWRFLQRNRLIAAVSQATVVVEAGRRSGSLNTAAHANELNRPLGAVPGPVTSMSSAGCHRLLRDYAAVCVTSADDVVGMVGMFQGAEPDDTADSDRPSAEQLRVLDALSKKLARPTDDVARRAGLSVSRVQSVLGGLQLEGSVLEDVGGWRAAGGRRMPV